MEHTVEQKKQILETLSYHWTEADEACILPQRSRSIWPAAKLAPSGISASTSYLDILPLELRRGILQELDLKSLVRFRGVSRRSREDVDELPAFDHLMRFAPDTLQTLHGSGLLSEHSAKHLDFSLSNARCGFCTEYGPYLFFLTGRRICLGCIFLQRHQVGVFSTAVGSSISGENFPGVPKMRAMEGFYGAFRDIPHALEGYVVCEVDTGMFGLLFRGTEVGVLPGWREMWSSTQEDALLDLLFLPHRRRNILTYYLGYMTCSACPSFDRLSCRTENGIWCRGCEYNMHIRNIEDAKAPPRVDSEDEDPVKIREKADVAYTHDRFLSHFDQCDAAKMLWNKYISKDLSLPEGESIEDLPWRSTTCAEMLYDDSESQVSEW